jgi:hypothetical protein
LHRSVLLVDFATVLINLLHEIELFGFESLFESFVDLDLLELLRYFHEAGVREDLVEAVVL